MEEAKEKFFVIFGHLLDITASFHFIWNYEARGIPLITIILLVNNLLNQLKYFDRVFSGLKSYWNSLKDRMKEHGKELLKLKDTLIHDLRNWLQETTSQKEVRYMFLQCVKY